MCQSLAEFLDILGTIRKVSQIGFVPISNIPCCGPKLLAGTQSAFGWVRGNPDHFQVIDADGSGTLHIAELVQACQRTNRDIAANFNSHPKSGWWPQIHFHLRVPY